MKTYEYRVIVDVDTEDESYPSPEEVRKQVNGALLCHFTDIPFGDEEQWQVHTWTVDEQDPETSATYYEQGLGDEDERNNPG